MKNKRQIISWCLFDFANSSYSAVIAAVIFPVYYTNKIALTGGDLWWGRTISLSMAVVALSSPFLGGIADFGGQRKRLLIFYTMLCIVGVALFSILKPGMALAGALLILVANIGMEGGLVFYNSFLPDIAEKEYQGRVSSWGYGVGYLGSIAALVAALPLVKAGHFSIVWLMVSGMFFGFALPAFVFLPSDRIRQNILHAARQGAVFTYKTFKKIWSNSEARKFLAAYLIYEDGVNTVIVFSSIFAATTLGFSHSELVTLYIIVQFTALFGAFIMARPTDYWGPKKVVMLSLILWVLVCISAFFASSKNQFWAIAITAGLGLGTVQAATRAFFAQFVPKGNESEYFGVYALVGKSSAIMGPYIFGRISASTGSQRPAILFVAVFFLVGLLIMRSVRAGGPNVQRD